MNPNGWRSTSIFLDGPLVPIRADLAAGDLRALYIAWLAGAQNGEFDDDDEEPPCPPGLGKLSAALGSLAEFLRIDRDLIEEAATASPDLPALGDDVRRRWGSTLSEKEKMELLARPVGGREAHLGAEILMRVRKWCVAGDPAVDAQPRTVRDLLEAAERRAEERRGQQRERATREKERREREEAAARELRLNALAKREEEAWRQVGALIATKQPKNYDEATVLLRDLRDLCVRAGRQAEAAARIQGLQQEHAGKRSFIKRLREADLHAWPAIDRSQGAQEHFIVGSLEFHIVRESVSKHCGRMQWFWKSLRFVVGSCTSCK